MKETIKQANNQNEKRTVQKAMNRRTKAMNRKKSRQIPAGFEGAQLLTIGSASRSRPRSVAPFAFINVCGSIFCNEKRRKDRDFSCYFL